jgi:type II secretory pathway component GspD/PulD (secretin)
MPGRYVSRILAVIGVALVAGWSSTTQAADPTFVGVLSLAVEKDVADKIDLSDEVRTKLQDMVAEREEAALELVLEIKDLSEEEKAKKLAPFVAASEKMGLALLTDEQRAGLEQARIAHAGMLSLTEAPVSKKLKFTSEQQEKIASLLKEREEQLATTSDDKRSIQLRYYEQKLAKVLTPEQKAKWDELAGLQKAEKDPDDEGTAKSDDSKTDDTKSGDSKPDVAKTDDSKTDDSKTDDSKTDDAKTDDAKSDDSKTDVAEMDDSKPVKTRPETSRPSTTRPSTSKPSTTKVTGKDKEEDDDERVPVVRHKVSPDGKLRFNFRSAAWKDVLDWFSAQADLSLEADTYPPGTFNYTDKHAYTVGEALDVLNGMLLTKGYTLVRRGRLLMVINLEDAPPFDRLVSRIEPKQLDERGEFELVGCLFQLDKMSPEDAESEIKKLIGPQGSIVVLSKSRQIYVTESAGKLRTIRSIIERVENPDAGRELKLTEILLEHISPETALQSIRPLMGIPEDRSATPDGALKMVPDEKAGRLIVSGKPDAIAKIQEIIKLVDIPTEEEEGPSLLDESPQIAVYKLAGLDANVVLPVMQTILADMPNVRLTIDAKANSLIAQAPIKQHNTISETLKEMQKDKSQFDVITLRRVDPQLAVLTINKMFGAGEGGDPNAPKVDADPTTRQLIVRGTNEQIASIRSLLEKMGEAGGEDVASEDRGPVRVLGYAGSNPQALFDQAKEVWPTVTTNSNRLRFVTPAKDAATNRPREMRVPREKTPEETPVETDPTSDVEKQFNDFLEKRGLPPLPTKPKAKAAPADAKSTQHKHQRVPAKFAAYQLPADDSETEEFIPPPITKKPGTAKEGSATGEKKEKEKEKKPSKPGAEIVVSVGPSGIVIASEDLEALDEFEALLRSLMDRTPAGGAQDFTIVYLKYAKADIAAALLQEILGAGGGDAGGGGGGGGLLGNIASMALGGGGGGGGGDLIGGLLGLGGGGDEGGGTAAIQTTGKVTIIPDPRLNALVVQAGPSDLELVEQLLKVIDQEFSPEDVQTQPIPRMIAVKFVTADEVAAVVREVYSSRIAAAAGGGGQRQQPSPEEFIRALRGGGGRGGRGGAGDKQRGEEQKMTIGVDKRSNSLIVSAPDPLFREVEKLVAQIDKAGTETDDVTTVVQIKNASPELVKNAISAHFGDKAQMNTTPQTAGPQATQGGAVAGGPQGRGGQGQGQGRRGGQGGQGGGAQDPAAFFNGLQQAIQGGGAGGGRGGQRGGAGGGGQRGGGGGGAGGGRGGR